MILFIMPESKDLLGELTLRIHYQVSVISANQINILQISKNKVFRFFVQILKKLLFHSDGALPCLA